MKRNERTLVVGVDFGTSTTKVVWQDLSDNHFEVIQWRPSIDGLSSFLLPSTILLRGGSIHFGISEADAGGDDILLHSIKLCVLCRRKPSICRCGNSVARHGMILLPGSEQPIPASSFACMFLAHVFHEIEQRLRTQFPEDDLVLIWNIGCPMDHLDVEDLRSEWERMTGAAIELRQHVSSQADMSLLAEATKLVNAFVVPAPSERSYFVQPEGLAAVKAFLESPHAESKTYAIVDVGAGTTEVSFFFNGKDMRGPGQPFRPCYLADSTDAVGGLKIDEELAQAWCCSVEEARRRKENELESSSIPVVPSVQHICCQYRRTCGEILKDHKLHSQYDKRFDLFVIGGGGRLRPLQEALQRQNMPGGFLLECLQQLKPPRSLKNGARLQAHYNFLSVACGLASSLDWNYYRPQDVDPMPAPRTRPKPDVEQLYPK